MMLSISSATYAQLPQTTCRANAAGDGWICETTTAGAAASPRPEPQRSGIDRAESRNPPAASSAAVAEPVAEIETVVEPGPDQPVVSADPDTPTATDSRDSVEDTADAKPVPVELVPGAFAAGDDLDWVPRELMSEAQLEALPANCCGAFVDPSGIERNAENNPATAETLFRTSAGIRQISTNLITVDGDIVVQQGYRRVQNDNTTTIDRAENTVLMQGNVVFREPNLLLRGSSAFINNDEGISRIENAQYVIHDLGIHGTAGSIVYTSESGLVSIENGEFSRCEPDNSFWHIEAASIVLDQERGRGYARSARLKIKNVPVFYYPFTLQFPLGDERISGFLAPSTGSTRSGGFDFELPYYLNLAPNYDATISPRIISDRGVLTSTEFRYLSRRSMNTLNMSFLGSDELFDPATVNVPGSDSPPTEDRWFLGYEHFGNYGRNWSSFVDYNAVSDEDYFQDLGSNGLNATSRTHLNRLGRLNFRSAVLRGDIRVQRVQIIDPLFTEGGLATPYDRLPQLNFESDAYLAGGFRVGLSGQITAFDRNLDEDLFTPTRIDNGALVTGERVNLEPAINWSMEAPGWFLRADAKYVYSAYKLQDQAIDSVDDPDFGIGVYSFDSGLIFERSMSGAYTQTLEPRVFYLFSEFEDQDQLPLFDTSELNFSFSQLFRDDRFSGGDRVADADQVSIAVTSRILDALGRERARVSVGQIRYFQDRRVTMRSPSQTFTPRYSTLSSSSALAAEFAYSFSDSWQLNADVQWNQDSQEIEEGSFALRYHRDASHLLNLSYRFRGLALNPNLPVFNAGIDTRIKQTDLSGVWPLSKNWKLLGRWNYDHSNSRNLESFAGIEYSNCCATIRLIGREWVDEDELFLPNIEPNRGIFVQFTLIGLGNITGGNVSSLLRDGIWGFREPTYE
ncbi:MAG: LPS-assembly protein LptD [Proteobacteria bacterium]|nr:LPS-assembly protein LptD [Pseudomonadota bacterium]